MCMWNFDAEQIFLHKMTAFLIYILPQLHPVNGG